MGSNVTKYNSVRSAYFVMFINLNNICCIYYILYT